MRTTRVLSISMPEAQAKAAEQLAKTENRTMSELFREALRAYEKQRREEVAGKYRRRAKSAGLTEDDVVRIVNRLRKQDRPAPLARG